MIPCMDEMCERVRCFLPFLSLLAVTALPLHAESGFPPVVQPARNTIPDLTQTNPKGNFPGRGATYCGPVAVSNSLWALFGREYEWWEEFTQFDLVRKLASQPLMNIEVSKGCTVKQLTRGVDNYLRKRGEKNYYLKFQGWRPHDNRHATGLFQPRLGWIKKILSAERSAVWLNVGWYCETPDKGPHKRIGGHWVTAVGYGIDEKGRPDPDYLIIHDPAPRAGPPAPEFVKLSRIKGGVLTGVYKNLPRPAAGFYLMKGGMHLKPEAHHAVLDGAVGLVLRAKEQKGDPLAPEANPAPDPFR